MHDDFAAFVDAQLPRLLGYARALAGNPHDAWDLTQDVLVRLGGRWSRVDEPLAYARTSLVRANIDRVRRRSHERLVAAVPESGSVEGMSALDPWLEAALDALPVRQRTAVVLRYVDDLDHAGIAAAMGCSVGTARSHVSRALATLRAQAPAGSAIGGLDV